MDYVDRVKDTFSGVVAEGWETKSNYIFDIKGSDNLMMELISNEIDSLLSDDIELLEIGCGTAKLIKKLYEHYKTDINITGIEMSKDMISKAYNLLEYPNIEILEKSFEEYFCDKKFDVIILKQVFHHMRDKRNNLKHMKELLKSDGKIIMMFPNEKYQSTILPFKEENNLLGRINRVSMEKYVSNLDMEILDIIDTHCVVKYKNLKDYFSFLYSIGSIQKIFAYESEKYSVIGDFIELFGMTLSQTNEIQVDFDYSYYILGKKG